MRGRGQLALVGLVLMVASTGAAAQAAAPTPSAAWMAGCWSLRSGNRIVEEQWLPERGGVMLGMSRTAVGDRTTEYEFVVLRRNGATLEYRVRVGEQPEVVFVAKSPGEGEIVFENLQHDFPKRVAYRRVGADSLEAWIDAGPSGKGPRMTYAYHRASCGAP